jgi:hypothetical protein
VKVFLLEVSPGHGTANSGALKFRRVGDGQRVPVPLAGQQILQGLSRAHRVVQCDATPPVVRDYGKVCQIIPRAVEDHTSQLLGGLRHSVQVSVCAHVFVAIS